jgi:hypothetical protein
MTPQKASPQAVDCALNDLRLDEIARLADLAASYWRSVSLAAERGETHLLALHCKQVSAVTREAFALAREVAAEKEGHAPGKDGVASQTRTGRNPAHARKL